MDILDGVADGASEQDKEPKNVESQHQHQSDAEGSVQAAGEQNALEVKKSEEVVEQDQQADDYGADERGAPEHARIRNGTIEDRQGEDHQDRRSQREQEDQRLADMLSERQFLGEGRQERGGGQPGGGREEEEGAQR